MIPQNWGGGLGKLKTKLVTYTVTASLTLRDCRRDWWGHQDIFWHGLHSKDTEVPWAIRAAVPEQGIAVYLTDKQILDQTATSSWPGLVSRLHYLKTSGLMERVGTKLGLLLSYKYCHAGLGQAEHKVRRNDNAELPRGCATKQGSLQRGGLPQSCGSSYLAWHTTIPAPQLHLVEMERGHSTVLQMV